ncbi:MAG TPA: multidrug transporter subunit MdtA, partial [Casimicrobiaceae bacterium]
QAVRLGPVDGEKSVVAEGLKAGDRVVTDGTDKLRDGAAIEPVDRNAAAAAAAAATSPRTGAGGDRAEAKGMRRREAKQ